MIINKKKLGFFLSLLMFFVFLTPLCFAGPLDKGKIGGAQVENFTKATPFITTSGDKSLANIVTDVTKAFLGLLGVIFFILMLKAGYDWMTAQGDEKKVESSIHTIRQAVIGLLIIVAAYSITYFVMKNIQVSGDGSPSVIK